jgi:uncharacterized protein YyaL (SSP411 family)
VDDRRFADAGAAMVRAASLALAVTGEDLGFRAEYRERAPSGAIPHRLDAAGAAAGLLRDQALGLGAALAEYRLDGAAERLEWGSRVADWTVRHLWDDHASAFRASADGASTVTLPPIHPLLANGEMALALLDLAAHTGRGEHRERAERVIASLASRAAASPAGPALALAALRRQEPPPEAALSGAAADARTRALARAAVGALGPAAVVRWTGGGAPRLTLCANDVCSPPVADAGEMLEALADLDLAPRGILAHRSSSAPERDESVEEAS